MAANIYWDTRAQTRLIIEFSQSVTWEEFQTAVRQAHSLVAAVDQDVDLVVWAKTHLPDGMALPRLRAAFESQPPNVGRIIIIPHEKRMMLMFARQLAGVMHRLFPKKSKILFVDTIEEARALSEKVSLG